MRMLVRNGEWHWFRVRDIPFKFDRRGNVTHTIGVAREIHEQKSWEDVLLQKEELLNKILGAQSIGLVIYKTVRSIKGEVLDYEFVSVSKTFEDFHRRRDLVGKWVFEEFPQIKVNQYDKWKSVVEKNHVITEENTFPDPETGKIHHFRLKFEKLDDGLMVVWEDITSQKERDQKLIDQASKINVQADVIKDQATVIFNQATTINDQAGVMNDQVSVMNDQAGMITHQNDTINEQVSMITGQATKIVDQTTLINEQKEKLSDKRNKINSQNAEISGQNKMIKKQSAKIEDQANTINDQANTINDQANTINDQANTINDQANTIKNYSQTFPASPIQDN